MLPDQYNLGPYFGIVELFPATAGGTTDADDPEVGLRWGNPMPEQITREPELS